MDKQIDSHMYTDKSFFPPINIGSCSGTVFADLYSRYVPGVQIYYTDTTPNPGDRFVELNDIYYYFIITLTETLPILQDYIPDLMYNLSSLFQVMR